MRQGRQQPTATQPPVRAGLAAVLVALCLAATAAQDTTPSPASSTADDANFTSPCICTEDISLNCSSLSLTQLTEEYNTCKLSVVALDVSNNLLESIDGLEEWHELVLNASFNKIGEIDASNFHRYVDVVDVSWNQISKLNIENAQTLRQLNVSHNQLVRVEALPYLCELQWLDLSHNLLEEIPDGLSECKELEMLNLSYNALHTFPVGALDFLTSQEDNIWTNLVVDLRGNNLNSDDPTLLEFLSEINVTASEDVCSCAKLAQGPASFTLCVSAMCIDGREIWSLVNSTKADAPRIGSTENETACEENCEQISTSADPTATDTSSTITESLTSPGDETSSTTSLPSITDETSTISLSGASDELSTTISSSAPPLPPIAAPPAPPPAHDPGSARRGGVPEGTPPPRPPPPPPPPSPAPGPEPATPAPGRDERRRRRLYVTLGLTLVVLAAAGAGAAALYTIYKRRRRQLLEEQSQRVAMMPLVGSGTPRSLRAADDDFVP